MVAGFGNCFYSGVSFVCVVVVSAGLNKEATRIMESILFCLV